MPTIYKPKKKQYGKRAKAKAIYDAVYNTSQWRQLRAAYLMEHPLCECCQLEGRVTPATQVHHKMEISTGSNLMDFKELGFDPSNLMALCGECHQRIHAERHSRRNFSD